VGRRRPLARRLRRGYAQGESRTGGWVWGSGGSGGGPRRRFAATRSCYSPEKGWFPGPSQGCTYWVCDQFGCSLANETAHIHIADCSISETPFPLLACSPPQSRHHTSTDDVGPAPPLSPLSRRDAAPAPAVAPEPCKDHEGVPDAPPRGPLLRPPGPPVHHQHGASRRQRPQRRPGGRRPRPPRRSHRPGLRARLVGTRWCIPEVHFAQAFCAATLARYCIPLNSTDSPPKGITIRYEVF